MTQAKKWRLIQTLPASGAWNMALDEAIMKNISKNQFPPVLRLFAWNPPCMSLGITQKSSDLDLDSIQKNGWGLVRRPTGGKAILHTDELTYSVIAPEDDPVISGNVLQSYHKISNALLKSLEILSLSANADSVYDPNIKKRDLGPVCFEVPSNYEITVQGKKLIGSAQSRREKGFLQHGTLPLYGDLTRIVKGLKYNTQTERDDSAQKLLQHAVTIENVINKKVSWKEAADAFRLAFQETFNIEFEVTAPTQSELDSADKLIREKYGSDTWTFKDRTYSRFSSD